MKKLISDNWGIIRNTVGVDSVTFFNRETLDFEVYEEGEIEESNKLLRIPYDCELYNENKVLGEYIAINNIEIPSGSDSARCYLRETGQIYDFRSYCDKVYIKKLNEWFKENQIEVEFQIELESQEITACVVETQEELSCVEDYFNLNEN